MAKSTISEAEWLALAEPKAMLDHLNGPDDFRKRKLRLFACACCRRIEHLLVDPRSRAAIDGAERLADGRADEDERVTFNREAAAAASRLPENTVRSRAAWACVNASYQRAGDTIYACYNATYAVQLGHGTAQGIGYLSPEWLPATAEVRKAELAAQCALVRDLLGPLLFRAVAVEPAWLTANDGSARKLAQTIDAERAYDQLPVLADALEDAGCADAEVLGHLRSPGPHVRGCWVLDLLLGRG